MAANLLSYHLPVLRETGLTVPTRRGRWVDYRLDSGGFSELWVAVATAGVPLPGETIADTRAEPVCVEARLEMSRTSTEVGAAPPRSWKRTTGT